MPREKIVNIGLVDDKQAPQKQPDAESPRNNCIFATFGSVLAIIITAAIVAGVYFNILVRSAA